MLNLDRLVKRYSGRQFEWYSPMGYLKWGGKTFYTINSDKEVYLNSTSIGFILNSEGKVEVFNPSTPDPHYPLCPLRHWGNTLRSYYPHPWYPNREIDSFIAIENSPFFTKGVTYKVKFGKISSLDKKNSIEYTVKQCLFYPEFFKPIYK